MLITCVCVCVDKGWSSWLGWSPCSVTCGGVGVRKRKRECSSPPQCRMACSGPSEETERCAAENTCPGNIDVIHALRVHRLICVESFGGTGVFLIKVKGKWCVLLLKRFSKVFPILSSHLSLCLTCAFQSTVVGPAGLAGLIVLLRASLNQMAMSSFPPGCDIAPALTPSRQTTHRHLATVALETPYRCSTVASFPTVQVREEPTHDVIRKRSKLSNYLSSYWLSLQRTAAGARGLHSGHAQSPVGRGCSCQKGNVIAPPLDMEAKSAKGRALRARFVRVHVQVTHTLTNTWSLGLQHTQ